MLNEFCPLISDPCYPRYFLRQWFNRKNGFRELCAEILVHKLISTISVNGGGGYGVKEGNLETVGKSRKSSLANTYENGVRSSVRPANFPTLRMIHSFPYTNSVTPEVAKTRVDTPPPHSFRDSIT